MSEPDGHDYPAAISSFVDQTRALVKAQQERDAALATLARAAALCDAWEQPGPAGLTTEWVAALRLRAALEPTP